MHQPIRDYLEEYLRGTVQGVPREFQEHLEECEDCAGELRSLERQSRAVRALKSTELEPRAGFYARVLERIEAQQQSSIWSAFLERKFGLRLAIASAALALLMGAYLVSTEPGSVVSTESPAAFSSAPVADAGLQPDRLVQQQRDAVLVDLASYHE